MYNNGYPFFNWEYTGSSPEPPTGSSPTSSDVIIVNNIVYDCSTNLFETYENITTEVWKRILNNLPYLYKTKGTIRGLKALITCYGIPSSILSIKEYGGPDLDVTESFNEYKFETFTPVLPFYASQSISFAWQTSSLYSRYPSVLQIRFATTGSAYTNLNSMSLVEVPGAWSLSVIPTGQDAMGKIKFQLLNGGVYTTVTSSAIPIYDDKYVFVNIQRESASDGAISQTFNLDVKKYTNGSILYAASGTLNTNAATNIAWRSPGTVVIGGSGSLFANPFYGKLDEFRLWDTPLVEGVINTHVKFPESYIGNTLTGSYTDLLLRFAFDDPLNMASFHTASFGNSAGSNGYTPLNISIHGWTDAPVFPYSYLTDNYEGEAHALNIGMNRYSSNKVRIESGSLARNLSSITFAERGQYDTAQLDSNKLGIFFSPVELINEDIIKILAVSDIGDLIGNPAEVYNESYSDLQTLSKLYWKLGSNRISTFDYLNYIKYYDPSLFDHIKEFIPARCQTILGVLYEPTILERAKVKHIKPEVSRLDYSDTISMPTKAVTGSYDDLFVSIPMDVTLINNSFNFEKSNIYSIISTLDTYTGISGSVYEMATPIIDFDTDLIYYSGSGYFGIIKTSKIQLYDFVTGYNPRHYKNYSGYYTWEKRLKYEGCSQNESTTLDKLAAFEVWETNPNRLTARDDGRSNLQVN